MSLSDYMVDQRRAQAEQEYRANEQAAIMQEQTQRRRLSDLMGDPNVQSYLARDQENKAMARQLQANPKLQEQFMLEREKARLRPPSLRVVETASGPVIVGPDGTARPLMNPQGEPYKPKATDKPITEAQGKNAMYGSRAMMSNAVLTQLEEKINKAGLSAKQGVEKIPVVGGVGGMTGNTMLSANQQRVEQAQRNFVNALLRQESGAVISDAEFSNAQKQYFAQPGDDKKTIEQKRQNRQIAIKGFKAIAGPAWAPMEEEVRQISSLRDGSASQNQAPPAALEYLNANPQTKDAFKAKYGYLPQGL